MNHKIKVLFLDIDNTLLDWILMQVLHGEWSSASGRQDWNTDQKCFLYLQKKTTKYGRGLSAES